MATPIISSPPSLLQDPTLILPCKADSSRASKDAVSLTLDLGAKEFLEKARLQLKDSLGPQLAPSLNIGTVLNVCWIITARCFSPARVIYLDFHHQSGLCHISDSYSSGRNTTCLEIDVEKGAGDLIRNCLLIEANLSTRPTEDNFCSDSQKNFLRSAVRYVDHNSMTPRNLVPNVLGLLSTCEIQSLIMLLSNKVHRRKAHLANTE